MLRGRRRNVRERRMGREGKRRAETGRAGLPELQRWERARQPEQGREQGQKALWEVNLLLTHKRRDAASR